MDVPSPPPHKPPAADPPEHASSGNTAEWERRYRALLEQTSEGVFVAATADRRIRWVNDAACRITAYSREELLAMGLDDLLEPAHPRAAPEVPGRPPGAATRAERTLRGKGGREIPVALSARHLDDGMEQLVAHDLTEFRAVIDTLRDSEAEMRALLGAMTDLIFVFDRNGVYRKIGPTSPELLYRPAASVIGRSLHEVFAPELADWMLAALRQALDEQHTVNIEYELPIQGTPRWFSAALSPMDAEQVVWVARDVTDRHEAYATLAALVDRSPLAIVGVDTDLRVSIWNPAAERMFGYSREEVMGRPVPHIPESRRGEHALVHAALVEGRQGVTNFETQRCRKDGSLVDVMLSTATITGPDGRPRFIAFIGDISERRVLEEELRQAQKMEAVGRLAGGIAHDFNNILTAIVNYSELLLQQADLDIPVRKDLEEILEASQRAARLTRQLLAFSRRQILQPQLIDIGEVVERMQAMLHRVIGEDIALETERAEAGRLVRADPGQVEQVILNLAINARDAMPTGGRLRFIVESRRLSAAEAEHHPGAASGEYVVLSATDTGHGVPPDAVRHIFEPFFTTKEVGKGTGLGLSTVYGVVQQSGGFVTVESDVGVGTTFRVFLPEWRGDAERASAALSGSAEASGCGTILLVEDDAPVRAVARRVLAQHGYRVLEATNGREALELLGRIGGPVDLVLTDYIMPELGGRALVERLRALGHAPAVLYMSGYVDDAGPQRGELAGGAGFLQKPFTRERLVAQVRQVLQAHGARER